MKNIKAETEGGNNAEGRIVGSVISLSQAFDIQTAELVSIVGGGGKTSLMFGLAAELGSNTVVTTTTRIFAAQMKLALAAVVYSGGNVEALDLPLDQYPFVLVVDQVQGDKALGVSEELPGALLKRPDVDYVLVEADGSRMRPVKAPADHEPVIPPQTTLVIPVIGIDALGGRVADVAHRPERVKALTGLEADDLMTAESLAALITHPAGGRKAVPPKARLIPLINKVETESQLSAARQIARLVLQEPEIDRVVIGAVRSQTPVVEVQQRVTAVILAAGQGRRMGQTKQLLPWGQTTVLGQTLRNVQASAVHNCLLVSGHEALAIEAIAQAAGVTAVHNPNYAKGEMLLSLQTAVRQLEPGCAAVLVMLADQPMVAPKTLDQILSAFWNGRGDLIAPTYAGRRGNPVLIGRRYFEELLALPAGGAPRDLIQKHQEMLHLVKVDSDSILRDLDRVEEYERWRP
jgi:molybdenum cofactor cytidylyltransferase